MVNLEKAKQALQDALGNADEWYAVEFARDYGAGLIEEVTRLQDENYVLKSLAREQEIRNPPKWDLIK